MRFAIGIAAPALALVALLAISSGKFVDMSLAAVMLSVAYVAGRAALTVMRLVPRGSVEALALSTPLGLGVLAYAALLLGAIGAFTPLVCALAGGVIVAISLVALRRRMPMHERPAPPRREPALAIGIGLLLLAVAPFPSAPEVTLDAAYYHLTIAREIAMSGDLAYLPQLPFTAFPLSAELLYAVGALFGALGSARYLHFAAGAITGLCVYLAGARLRDPRTGLLAATAWFATPLVLWEMATADIDLFVAMMGALSLLALLRWIESRALPDAILFGIALGFALGIKLTAAAAVAAFFAALAVVAMRSARDVRHLSLASIATVMVAAPWYVRSVILTGNPVFPYLNDIFHSPLWPVVNDARVTRPAFPADFGELVARLLQLLAGRFGSDVGLDKVQAFGLLPPILITAILIAALRRFDRRPVLLALAVLADVALWWVTVPFDRYLLPVFPAGAAVIAWAAAPLLAASGLRRLFARAILVSSIATAIPLFLLIYWNLNDPLPFALDLGRESEAQYLGRVFPQYSMFRWLDAFAPAEGAPILALRLSAVPVLYSSRAIFPAEWTAEGRDVLSAADAATALARLREHGFRYVVYEWRPVAAGAVLPLAARREFVESLREIQREGNLTLHEVP